MKNYTIFLLLSVFTLTATAQNLLFKGTVKLKNGNTVSDATVVIKSLNKHTLTDESGNFEFSEIKYGKYEVEVISVEVENKTFQIDFTSESLPVTLFVESSDVGLKEVVVKGNSIKRTIETKGFAVNVIETQKFALQSVQTNELLGQAAGVVVRQDGGLGSKIKYGINGLSGDAVKIFIDGMPASNYGGSFSMNSIPPALIERIEVYKGVVPGYLLDDALGGAINVVLKQRRQKSLNTSYSIGSFNTHQWNMNGSYRWKNGLTVDGSAFLNYSDNSYKVWGQGVDFKEDGGAIIKNKKAKRFHDAYKSVGGRFNIGFTDVKWADQFFVGGLLSKDYKEIQTGVDMKTVFGNRHSRQESGIVTFMYDKDDLFVERLSLKVDGSHSYLNRQLIDTVGILYTWFGPATNNGVIVELNGGAESGDRKQLLINREYINMVRANLNYAINDNHKLYMNYLLNDFERKESDKYKSIAERKLTNTRDLQKNVIAFTYENIAFSDRLRTNIFYKHFFQKTISNEPEKLDDGSYKVNKIKKEMDQAGYGLTVSYALLPNLYLLGSAERAVRMPNANEIFGVATEQTLVPVSPLKPEKSLNTNIGFNFGAYTIKDHTFNLNAMIYYRDTKDLIKKENLTQGSNSFASYKNFKSVLTKGIDVEFIYDYKDKINFRFNISKFDILLNTKVNEFGHPYNGYRKQLENEPSLKFNGNVSYSLSNLFLKNSRTSIRYNVNYVKEFYKYWGGVGTTGLSNIPTQTPMDIGLIYTFPNRKLVLSFDMKNMFNKQVYDNFGLQKPGRAFYGKITYLIF